MARIVALFGGQGAQYAGMGKNLYGNFAQARALYECAGDIFGFDVAALSFSGTPEELRRTEVAQSALFTLAVAAFTCAKDVLPPIEAAAGHSLGEYAALCCAGAFSPEDGMRILKARTAAMSRAAKENPGTMCAVIGKSARETEQACETAGGKVWAVNYNLPNQTVIAGTEKGCAAAAALLEAQGAKIVRLEVEGAFHTALMAGAADELRAAAQKCSFSPTAITFYSNLTGGAHTISDYPAYFVEHMLSPVRFVSQIEAMAADGLDTCIEFGPKKAVTLAKKNHKAFAALSIEDSQTLDKARRALGIA